MDELRSKLENSNMSRSQVENRLNQTLAQLEHAQQETAIKHRQVIEKVARIAELEGEIARLESTLEGNKKALYESELKLSHLEKSRNESHNSASKACASIFLLK